MTRNSVAYFPLRSNATSLLAGAPSQRVVARLKLASLLFDRILVEDGERRVQAGPDGGFTSWSPGGAVPRAWQRPLERRRARGAELRLGVKPAHAPADAPATVILNSRTSISWRATFEPLKRQLTRECGWFEFGHVDDPAERGFALARMDREAASEENVRSFLPETFVRNLIIKGLHRDLLVGAALGAAVNVDRFHARILAARVTDGSVLPLFGPQALTILVPEVRDLSWSDVAQVRANRGLRQYRAVLREVEEAAWDESSSPPEFARLVHQRFQARLLQVIDASSLPRRLVRAILGVAVGEMLGVVLTQAPGVGAVVGMAASAAKETAGWTRRRWVGTHQALRKIAQRPGGARHHR